MNGHQDAGNASEEKGRKGSEARNSDKGGQSKGKAKPQRRKGGAVLGDINGEADHGKK